MQPRPAIRPAFHSITPRIAKRAPTSAVFSRRGKTQMATPKVAIGAQP